MKYYKIVSGKGKVLMTDKEISEIFEQSNEPVLNEPTPFEVLEKKVEALSQTIEALSKSDIFKALFTVNERAGDKDGAL